jgi:hypothetical protein
MSLASDARHFLKTLYHRARDIRVRGVKEAGKPVVVYQMGKVGSTSISRSIAEHGVRPVDQVHRINPEHVEAIKDLRADRGLDPLQPMDERGLRLYHEIVRPGRPAQFISLVREPVSRNVSAYFQNHVGLQGWSSKSLGDLRDRFLNDYSHEVPMTWFEHEPKAMLDIDVYAVEFPSRDGFVRIEHGPFELLVLQTELPDNRKETIIQDFLGIDDFHIRRRNVGRAKSYAEAYNAFKKQIRLPRDYLDRMLQSRYAQHFYDQQTIDSVYRRWTKRDARQEA